MTIFSENIALFTVPALKNSRKLFLEFWLYIFSNNPESSFKEEIYSQATHIWLGEKFLAEWNENNSGKYVKISLIERNLKFFSRIYGMKNYKDFKFTK